jgi:type II secretory pathway pseudopilin PulG
MGLSARNKKGFSVVEILIAIGMAAIMIVSIGSALNSVHKLNSRSEVKEKALAFAKEYLEIINEAQSNLFACSCTLSKPYTGTCVGDICTRGTSCTKMTGYSSCWLAEPGTDSSAKFHLVGNQLQPESETIIPEKLFQREITIENLPENPPGFFNIKKITVTVCKSRVKNSTPPVTYFTCEEQQVQFSEKPLVTLSTILTGWKNL